MKRLGSLWLFLWFGTATLLWFLTPAGSFELSRSLAPGHDTFGRALLPLTLESSLRSVCFASLTVVFSILISLLLAGLIALIPGRASLALQSGLDFLVAFPSLIFALSMGAWIGPGAGTVFIALILGSTPSLARLLLARVRELHAQPFVHAARAVGAGTGRILFKHLLPHLLPMISVKLPSLLMHSLIAEASMSFLGLGFSAGTESWGTLLSQARDYLIEAPEISLMVGTPLLLSIWALDAISKHLEPELR